MRYEIITPMFKPKFIFTDEELIVGNKSYSYSQMTGLKIATKPTQLASGMIRFRANGEKLELLYSPKSAEAVEKGIAYALEKTSSMNGKWTADDLYELAAEKNFASTLRQKQAVQNFAPAVSALGENEEVVFSFTGTYKKMNTEDEKKIRGNCSFVATKERMLVSQQKAGLIDSVLWDEIKEMTFREVDLLGILVLKLQKGVISISVECKALKEIYLEMKKLTR